MGDSSCVIPGSMILGGGRVGIVEPPVGGGNVSDCIRGDTLVPLSAWPAADVPAVVPALVRAAVDGPAVWIPSCTDGCNGIAPKWLADVARWLRPWRMAATAASSCLRRC